MVICCVVFPYLDFTVRSCSHFSASMGCKLLCVHHEIMYCLWLKKEAVTTSYEGVSGKQPLFCRDTTLLFMHTQVYGAGQFSPKHTQLAYNGGKDLTNTGMHQLVIIIMCTNMYCRLQKPYPSVYNRSDLQAGITGWVNTIRVVHNLMHVVQIHLPNRVSWHILFLCYISRRATLAKIDAFAQIHMNLYVYVLVCTKL